MNGCTAHVRKRSDDRYRCSYEIRYRKDGYNISASAQTLEAAKEKFIEKLRTVGKQKKMPGISNVPTKFNEFAYFWLDNFYKRKVAEKSYKNTCALFKRHIAHRFENVQIARIRKIQNDGRFALPIQSNFWLCSKIRLNCAQPRFVALFQKAPTKTRQRVDFGRRKKVACRNRRNALPTYVCRRTLYGA